MSVAACVLATVETQEASRILLADDLTYALPVSYHILPTMSNTKTVSDDGAAELDEFTLFPKLLVELQVKKWKMSNSWSSRGKRSLSLGLNA
jgi:hypothetical protein